MATDDDPPEPPDVDEDAEGAGVLSPEELDILEDENVYQIEDGRFVIRADDGPDVPVDDDEDLPIEPVGNGENDPADDPVLDAEPDPDPDESTAPTADSSTTDSPSNPLEAGGLELDQDDLYDLLESYVSARDANYGFHITAKFEDRVDRRVVFTNDVVTSFGSLVSWYAQHAGDDTPVEDVLGILLVEMDLPVRYPTSTLERYLEAHDLDAEDSIGELLDVVRERGFRFPH